MSGLDAATRANQEQLSTRSPAFPQVMEVIEATPRIVRQVAGHSPIKGRIDARAKLRKAWTIHDLRQTVASGLPKIGVKLPVIERVLNHKGESLASLGSTNRMTSRVEKRDAFRRWADTSMW
jgi:hypothetical protein